MRPWQRRVLVVPTLMVAVGLLHAGRVATIDQSSWQGAGFGMFATYDFDGTRAVVAVASVREEVVELPLEAVAHPLERRARVTPTDAILRDIAHRLRPTAPQGTTTIRVEVRGPRMADGIVQYAVINGVVVDG